MRLGIGRLLVALGAVSAIACEPERPANAYVPEGGINTDTLGTFGGGGQDTSMDQQSGDQPDAGDQTQQPDAPDGGSQSTQQNVDPSNPLAPLLGRYLMRIDIYATDSATKSGLTVTLASRASTMLLSTVTLNPDGTLTSTEQLCAQTIVNQCSNACSGWTTDVDADSKKFVANTPPLTRTVRIDGNGKLTADGSGLQIGFNDDNTSSALPTSPSDPRVWMLTKGAGFNTRLRATLGTAPITEALDCVVASVQRLNITFAGQLDLSKGADALTAKPMLVDTTAIQGVAISATGTPTDGTCSTQSFAKGAVQDDGTGIAVVRFQRYTADSPVCPGSSNGTWDTSFEQTMPGAATAPTSDQLM